MLTNHTLQITIRGELGRRATRRAHITQPLERTVRTELRRRDARALPLASPRRGVLIAAEMLAHPFRGLPADAGGLWARPGHRAIPSWGLETHSQRAAA